MTLIYLQIEQHPTLSISVGCCFPFILAFFPCRKPEASHIGESWKPEYISFLSLGSLSETWGFHVVYHGKLEVSMSFLMLNLGNPGFPHVFLWKPRVSMSFSPGFHVGKPSWFPCKGIQETVAHDVSLRVKPPKFPEWGYGGNLVFPIGFHVVS